MNTLLPPHLWRLHFGGGVGGLEWRARGGQARHVNTPGDIGQCAPGHAQTTAAGAPHPWSRGGGLRPHAPRASALRRFPVEDHTAHAHATHTDRGAMSSRRFGGVRIQLRKKAGKLRGNRGKLREIAGNLRYRKQPSLTLGEQQFWHVRHIRWGNQKNCGKTAGNCRKLRQIAGNCEKKCGPHPLPLSPRVEPARRDL